VVKVLTAVLRELIGLFVDDSFLAIEILVAVAVAAIAVTVMPAAPLMAGGILIFGCLGVLLVSVTRAGRR